ncbi:Ig-like domain-containing protein [Anaerovorax odorimutans]|uniref:Ig-like domain-containing protein n=1 Tax=Anaerovorax odorimutans TaxID=109327 RepID=A0ABT1RSL4_9FIRM|nr:Ig-like domain-containing protein [Anaerovorax odorimutans]MCQ4638162.1 Ig-like domain-containing protein [Anaerovorax odorimutans]
MKRTFFRKLLAGVLSAVMLFSVAPGMAFAADENSDAAKGPHKWVVSDWDQTNTDTYGTAVQSADPNVTILTQGAYSADNNGYNGPYAKPEDEQKVTLEKGSIVREINVLIGPKALDGGSFGVTASLNKPGEDEYLTEMTSDFRPGGDGNIVYSAYDQSNLYTIKEDAVYTIRWEFSMEEQGEGGVIYGEQSLLDNGKVLATTKKVALKDGDLSNDKDAAKVSNRSMWFYNISVADGVKVFTELPKDKELQKPHKYVAKDWITAGGYGAVSKTADDGTAFILKGGELNGDGYAMGPYSKKGNQQLADGPMVQEINVMIDPADEESYVDNNVKFALSCALNDNAGDYRTEMTYCLQKDGDVVNILGTDIKLDKKDVYTFRIVFDRDLFGAVYEQLQVEHRGKLVGETKKAKMSDLDKAGSNHDNASQHRQLWFSSINTKNGVAVYKDVPPYAAEKITLDKETMELVEGASQQLNAVVGPEYTTDKTVSWTSSDDKIAAVKDGKVTGVKPGKAVITAKTTNGKEAVCTVTVKAKPIVLPTGITLSKSSVSVAAGKSVTVTAAVLPANATNKAVSWTSSNRSIATVSNGKITAKKPGRTTVTATAANGKSAKITVTVQPKKVASLKVKTGKRKMTVSWKKDTKSSGYQLTYARNKSFKKAKKNVTISKNKTNKKVIKRLKSRKTYYVKVRAYKKIGSKKVYGAYSSVKKVKIR